jgi:tRNA1Val (adenine37-N6)-methyltransferase
MMDWGAGKAAHTDLKNAQTGIMELKPDERIEDLQNGFCIIQNPAYFLFGTDAVLLAHFAQIKAGERAADFGTGGGIIPILLCARVAGLSITGIEVQPELCAMAQKSVALNGLEDRINIVCGDIRDAKSIMGTGLDAVVCNPPYEKADSGKPHASPHVGIAKREMLCTLRDVAAGAAAVLRTGGRLYMIYRTERFAELTAELVRHKLEPKRIQMVAPRADKPPGFALVEARKGARPGVTFLPQMVIYETDGSYTPLLKKIYGEGD